MPQTQLADLTVVASELSLPCASYDSCSNNAEWAAWSSHGALRCPADGFICTPCKAEVEQDWASKLAVGSIPCGKCRVSVSGQVSEHLRFIKL